MQDIIQTIAQALDDQRQPEAAAFVRRIGLQGAQLCAAIGQPGLVDAVAQALRNNGMPGAAELAARVGAAAAGACQAIMPRANAFAAGLAGQTPMLPSGAGCGCQIPRPGSTPSPGGPACGCKPGGGGGWGGSSGDCVSPMQPGMWNCESQRSDVAPCDIDRIERVFHFQSITAAYAAGSPTYPVVVLDTTHVALILPALLVSRTDCIEQIIFQASGTGVPLGITVQMVGLQAENIYQDPNGAFVHAWTDMVFEKPLQLDTTEGRCACKELCTKVAAQGAVRMVLALSAALPNPLPGDFAASIQVDFRRRDWQTTEAGMCPPELLCGRERLTRTYAPLILPGNIPQYPPSVLLP